MIYNTKATALISKQVGDFVIKYHLYCIIYSDGQINRKTNHIYNNYDFAN